jgi:tetratricopeptide (TPR) repeat protein
MCGPRRALADAVRLHRAGKLGEAAARYRQVLAADPRNADALRLLGVIEAQAGNLDSALDLMKRAVKRAPKDPEAHYNLGRVLIGLGRHRDAAASLKKASAIRPGHPDTQLNLGVALKELGRAAEAERAFRKALDLDGGHAGALNNLGALVLELGRTPEATELLERAVRAAPGYARAHFNLGKARSAAGDIAGAEAAYRRAMELDPGFPDPAISLAVLRADGGAHEEALALNERALALAPRRAPEIRYNMSRSLRRLLRPEEGLAQLARALEARPDYTDALVYRARLLMDLGRLDEAEGAARQALAADPACAAAFFALSEIKTFAAGDPDLDAMAALADGEGLDDAARIYLGSALAKALDDAGDVDAAFRRLQEANALKFRSLGYGRDAVAQSCAAILARDAVASARGAGERRGAPAPLFVIGMPRSGTTLVEQILAAHPHVMSCGELPFMADLAERLPRRPDDGTLRALGDEYLDRIRERFGIATPFFTDKTPDNFRLVGLIRQALPEARIVHCTRSPLDTALACYRCLFGDGLAWTYDLGALAHYYGVHARMVAAWHAAFPGEILDVSYEGVVSDLAGNARRLLDFCGLGWDESCLEFHRNANPVATASNVQVRRPVHTGSVGKWRRYEAHLAPLRRALVEQGVVAPGD